MSNVNLWFASGESSLSVRSFRVEEGISRIFSAVVMARSPEQLDLETIVGHPASLRIETSLAFASRSFRLFQGVCNHAAQIRAEPTGLSTYELRIVPSLWLL